MPQPNDLSRSLVALDQNGAIIAVVELSQSSWLVAGVLPSIERQPRKKLEPVSLANFRSGQKAPLGSAVTGTDRRKPLQLWRGSQKVAHETCYRGRVLEVRRMTGARDDMDPRIGEALRELVRVY